MNDDIGTPVDRTKQYPPAVSPEAPAMDDPASARPPTRDVRQDLRPGPSESLDSLVELLYQELRRIAHAHLARRRRFRARQGTLATTGLVNEVYLKLVDQSQPGWKDRGHFLALAAVAMRHILIDRAKARVAQKRGGERVAVTLDGEAIAVDESPEALLDINAALERLATLDARLARVVECRFFGGLSESETAEALGVTVRTVQRDWAKAKMLLRRSLGDALE